MMSFQPENPVKLRIGRPPNHQGFVVNQDMVKQSELLTRAMSSPRFLSANRNIALPDMDPPDVNLYLHFLYKHDVSSQITTTEPVVFDVQVESRYTELARVYVVAEKLQDRHTKNATLRELIRTSKTRDDKGNTRNPKARSIDTVYAATAGNNNMRWLLTRLWCYADPRDIDDNLDMLPKEFLRDLANLRRRRLLEAEVNGRRRYRFDGDDETEA